MQAPETELKFAVPEIAAFHRSLAALNFVLKTPRTFESNTLFDTPDRQLRGKRQILRVRDYGSHHVVTHKRLSNPDTADVRYKTRIETESEVDDGAALAEIFIQLGFRPSFRYEKYRTEWTAAAGTGHLVLDETPIGTWAELEGDPSWIEDTLAALQVAPERCSVESYGVLFLHWKEQTGSPAENLTFEEIAPALA